MEWFVRGCATRVENAFHAKDGFAAKVSLQKNVRWWRQNKKSLKSSFEQR